MSSDSRERPALPDDLAQAYAQALALTDAGQGPAAAVRANVLAAAREIAAEAATRSAATPASTIAVTPVAAPVAAVGRGRSMAVNLSSWRVRVGASFCAALLVGVAGWRFDASRRFGADTQLASASSDALEMKVVATPPPRDMSPPQVLVPASPADVAATANAASPPPVAQPARDKDLVVAQADQPTRALGREAAQEAARAQPRNAARIALAPPAPVVVASVAPELPAPAPAPVVVATAAAPRDQVAAGPATVVQRGEITNGTTKRVEPASDAARPAFAAAKQSAPAPAGALLGASARLLPTPLQAAADRGDVEALRTLLANPAARVDAPDATGRTALLHAVLAQQLAAVRLLIGAGADPDRADQAGLTPRAAALTGANAEIATLVSAPR